MRKFALLVAAALVVSAPMLTTSTESFAAAKAKRAAKAAPAAQEQGSLLQAFSDQLAGINTGSTAEKQKRRVAKRKQSQ